MYDPWGCTDNKPKKYRADGGVRKRDDERKLLLLIGKNAPKARVGD